MKTEIIYYADFKEEKCEYLYDQYINSFITINKNLSELTIYLYIIENSSKKMLSI